MEEAYAAAMRDPSQLRSDASLRLLDTAAAAGHLEATFELAWLLACAGHATPILTHAL